ncbi:hypothetical protein PG997_008903 [Apiospora hydei]|uniref:Ankyrin n=1 Tax=Apiospora hydei TaxID=1337664 RepID=A0ABR1WC47_9PEZI
MMDLLLSHKADLNEPPARYAGATALQLSAIRGSIGITKKLIDLGADVNGARAPYRGRTALEGAAEHGRLDTVGLLLEQGCRIDNEGRDQYIRAVKLARDNDHLALTSLLEARGTWTDEDEHSLIACKIDEEEFVDPHEGCLGVCCSDFRSVDDDIDEPRCWETRSGVFEGDPTSHYEDCTMQEERSTPESPREYADLGEGEDHFYDGDSPIELAAQHGIEGSSEGGMVDCSVTEDGMSDWVNWAFDDGGNFLGPL